MTLTKKSNPYWYKLIKHLKASGTIDTGLTIPYLFGAHKILNTPYDSVEALILDVYNSEINKYPVIQRCDVIEQHVLKVEAKEVCNKYFAKDVGIRNPNFENILFLTNNAILGKTLNGAIKALTQIYDPPIRREEFSWNRSKKEWQKFSADEVKLILEIK